MAAQPIRIYQTPPGAQARKGRGAVSNMRGRYESTERNEESDGWPAGREPYEIVTGEEDGQPRLSTTVHEANARSILTRNSSPDLPFSVSLNPYRGCEHGCIYCYARPGHSYLGLSPGLDFETQIFAKMNAAELLRRELASPSWQPQPIALGVNTDAYQPIERELGITRGVMEILRECNQPVGLITKNALVERDIDLLAPMAARRQAGVAVTITTLDAELARKLEPRATTPARRLRTIRTLTEAGIPVSVSIAPLIPFVTEPDLERIMEAAADAGAVRASYIVLRLPWELGPLFREWLQAHFPDRAERVMNRIHDMRGGKDNEADFKKRMRGEGVWAEMIAQRFDIAARRLGLLKRETSRFSEMNVADFRRPLVVPAGVPRRGNGQMDLF